MVDSLAGVPELHCTGGWKEVMGFMQRLCAMVFTYTAAVAVLKHILVHSLAVQREAKLNPSMWLFGGLLQMKGNTTTLQYLRPFCDSA